MPNTPYGLAKYFSQENIKIYRKNHNIFACSAICFNHESERRSEKFVTRKISKNVADIYLKSSFKITLGNINARKDWGYAPEFVEAMHLMLQSSKPQDYVLSTYKLYSVKDILISAFQNVGILDWQNYVEYDESLANNRIAKENYGNYDKINQDLGWKPRTSILDVINKMVQYDIENTKINKKIFLLQ
jgi:GDPmannose 4,6-dehydratase